MFPAGRSLAGQALVPALVLSRRFMSEPGWQRRLSTKDSRTREQREAERKIRQLEKLPKPEALHDFEYPVDKTLLCDQWFQPPVYDSELDTPALYQMTSPSDFFVYWNATDFDRTAYPPLPPRDLRTVDPGTAEWTARVTTAREYLKKHEIVPQLFANVGFSRNINFVFGSANDRSGEVVPASTLTADSFWMSAHFGNYIELKELQRPPTIAFHDGAVQGADAAYYTMFIASPDYPFRPAPNRGFFLHSVVSNLKLSSQGGSAGDIVVDYVPPLPTEDAGAARVLCMLFRQTRKIDFNFGASTPLTFGERSNYRQHAAPLTEGAHSCSALHQVEAEITTVPDALRFFTTVWDIQVQEYYESQNLPEPRYWPPDVEDVLRFNALPLDYHRPSSRVLPDGSINDGTTKHQHAKLNLWMTSAKDHLSSKSLRDPNGKPLVFPKP
jgi:hypothetical protein